MIEFPTFVGLVQMGLLVGLAVTLLVLYWPLLKARGTLPHVLLITLSYCLLTGYSIYNLVMQIYSPLTTFRIVYLAVTYGLGDVALFLLLVRFRIYVGRGVLKELSVMNERLQNLEKGESNAQ